MSATLARLRAPLPAAGACPMCGADAMRAFVARDVNRRITEERFAYERCTSCSTVFMAAPPEDLGRYYGQGYHPFDESGEPRWRSDQGLLRAESWRIAALRRFVEPGALIDVGAGAGGFAAGAVEAGFEVTAIEMDRECCEFMATRLGVTAICTDQPLEALRALPPARVITFWHVLEHLKDPGEMLSAAVERLEPGGVLGLAVPNPGSLQFRLLQERWAHLDAPRHLCLLTRDALLARVRGLGLEPLLETTSDPSGLACNIHGWVYGLRRDPAGGPVGPVALLGGARLAAVMDPIERRGLRGAALTMLLRRPLNR